MDPRIDTLLKYGYNNHRAVAPLIPADADEVFWGQQSIHSELGQAMLASYQLFMYDAFEELVWKHHDRGPSIDGDFGPASADLLKIDRCGCPDFFPAQAAANGTGSWRPGCLGNPSRYEVSYTVDFQNCSYTEWWDEIERTVVAAYAEAKIALVRKPLSEWRTAQINILFERLGGNVIGLAMLPGSGNCNYRHFCKLHPGYKPNINQVCQLLAHELGHNMNSGHISNDPIMHPSMTSKYWSGSFKSTAFGNRLANYFRGGDDIKPPPPDKPDPPSESVLSISGTSTGHIVIRNTSDKPVTIDAKSDYHTKHLIVPATGVLG